MLSIGLLLLRVVLGLTVAAHGAQKLFGWFGGPSLEGFSGALEKLGIRPSRPWAVVAGLAEFGGGLLLALGLFTPLAALVVAGGMLVAVFTVHWPKGFWNAKGGLEFPFLIAVAAVALALTGPGAISLDNLFGVALPEPGTMMIGGVIVLLGVIAAIAGSRLQLAGRGKPELG
jgi:putative oxidoreductase